MLDIQPPELQEINIGSLSYWLCGILLKQPKQINTQQTGSK